MKIEEIEKRFKEVTKLSPDVKINYYPIKEHVGFEVRMNEKKNHGEVFTPLQLVDKMLKISKPKPDKYNMDLCSGHGQFTVRMLRKFIEENASFDIENYLKNLHWFNEINLDSVLQTIYIFGENINMAIGPAEELKKYPCDENKIWLKGIFLWDNYLKRWVNKDVEEIVEINKQSIDNNIKVQSKQLF